MVGGAGMPETVASDEVSRERGHEAVCADDLMDAFRGDARDDMEPALARELTTREQEILLKGWRGRGLCGQPSGSQPVLQDRDKGFEEREFSAESPLHTLDADGLPVKVYVSDEQSAGFPRAEAVAVHQAEQGAVSGVMGGCAQEGPGVLLGEIVGEALGPADIPGVRRSNRGNPAGALLRQGGVLKRGAGGRARPPHRITSWCEERFIAVEENAPGAAGHPMRSWATGHLRGRDGGYSRLRLQLAPPTSLTTPFQESGVTCVGLVGVRVCRMTSSRVP